MMMMILRMKVKIMKMRLMMMMKMMLLLLEEKDIVLWMTKKKISIQDNMNEQDDSANWRKSKLL